MKTYGLSGTPAYLIYTVMNHISISYFEQNNISLKIPLIFPKEDTPYQMYPVQ